MVVSIESHSLRDARNFTSIRSSIPSLKGTLLQDLDRLGFPRGIFGKEVILGTFSQVVSLSLRLIGLFNATSRASSMGKDYTARQGLSWILNGYQRLWRVSSTFIQHVPADTAQNKSRVIIQFVRCMSHFCGDESPLSGTPSHPWLRSLADILNLENLSAMPAVQLELSHLFGILTQTCTRSNSSGRTTGNIILPPLLYLKQASVLEKLDSAFQVGNL